MKRQGPIPFAEFNRILAELVDASPASALLSVPLVYDVVAEHFNKDVIAKWEQDNETL